MNTPTRDKTDALVALADEMERKLRHTVSQARAVNTWEVEQWIEQLRALAAPAVDAGAAPHGENPGFRRAWDAVAVTLSKVAPGWDAPDGTCDMERACKAIESLAKATTRPAADAGDGEGAIEDLAHAIVADMEDRASEPFAVRVSVTIKKLSALSRPAADSEAVAVVVENVVGVELVWANPPSVTRPPIGTKLYTRPSTAAVPEGYVLVPRKATQAMEDAGVYAAVNAKGDPWFPLAWEAAIAALTPAPRRIEREDAPTVDDGMEVGP
jgi:hypothetical protein